MARWLLFVACVLHICRVKLEQEYEEQHEVLGRRLDTEARKIQELQMQSAQLQKDLAHSREALQKEHRYTSDKEIAETG